MGTSHRTTGAGTQTGQYKQGSRMTDHIAIVVTARPSWAKLEPIAQALTGDVELLACAYALLHSYGSVVDQMRQIGHPVTEIWSALDGATLATSAQTTGHLTCVLGQHFSTSRPAAVVICADRHETLGASIAAAYQNLPILHLQGGEHSGSIDQKVRWANTALADQHAVATQQAYNNLCNILPVANVHLTGCPSIDVALAAQRDAPVTQMELSQVGTGASVDPQEPFALVVQHTDTREPDRAVQRLQEALGAAQRVCRNLIVLWPGADAGASLESKWLREWSQGVSQSTSVHLIRTLPPRRFLRLLGQATVAVGNSSALVREGSALGVPRILIGDRQEGRELSDGPSDLYGDGHATERIVRLLEGMR